MFLLEPIIGIPILFAIFLMLYGNYKECKLLIKVSTKLDKLLEAREIRAMDIMIKRAHFRWNKPRLLRLLDRQLDLLLGTNQSRIYFKRSLPFVNTISSELAYRRLLKKLNTYIRRDVHQLRTIPKRKYRSQIIFVSPVLYEFDKQLDGIINTNRK